MSATSTTPSPGSDLLPDLTRFVYLMALQRKPLYEGTVPPETVSERRKRGKAARRARRVTRARP